MFRFEKIAKQLQNKDHYDYIIVGAGIAGMYASKLLSENGIHNFIVLEAQEDIGGRIQTVKLGHIGETNKVRWIRNNHFLSNFAIQQGAAWIQQSHALMLHLSKQLGISLREQYRIGPSTYVTKDRIYSSKDIVNDHQFYKPLRQFLDKFKAFTKQYDKHVFSNFRLDNTYKEMVEKYDNMTMEDYLKQQIPNPYVCDFIHNFIEHMECNDLRENSVHQVLIRTTKSGILQMLQDYIGVNQDKTFLINGGSSVYLRKISQAVERARGERIQQIINFNQEVVQIDNSNPGNIKVKSIKHYKKHQTYTCKEVILAAPIAILHKIKISKLSLPKQVVLQNQSRGIVNKSFIITKRPFWKDKNSGDALYSKDYDISMSHDISPANNQCGILVFFHSGEKFTKWNNKFPVDIPDRSQGMIKFFVKLLAHMYLEGNQESQQLDSIVYVNSVLIDNRYTYSAFQSNWKPGTLTKLMQMQKVFKNHFDNQNGLIFIGSQFSEQFPSFMQGAVRSASRKIFAILGKEDPVIQIQKRNEQVRKQNRERKKRQADMKTTAK